MKLGKYTESRVLFAGKHDGKFSFLFVKNDEIKIFTTSHVEPKKYQISESIDKDFQGQIAELKVSETG